MKVALLHGFAGTPAAWDDVVAAWPGAGIEPVAIALPGHGPPAAASWADGVERVGAELARAGVDAVVGYSLGARVALGLLGAGHARAAVLVGVNPGLADDDADGRRARAAADAAWAALLRTRGTAAFADAWEAQPLFASQARAPAARRVARRAAREALDPEGLAASLETMGLARMPDHRASLAAHARRAHLVAGADDSRFVSIARALAAECPDLGLDLVPDSGHDPTLEQPGGLARVLARALERVTTRAPHPLSE